MKITENDIKKMIQESVKRINEYRGGYVAPDGNGMTGGSWRSWGKTTDTVSFCIDDIISEIELPEEIEETVDNGLKSDYNVNVSYEASYSESTGYGSKYNPVMEINDQQIDESFYDDVDKLPVDEAIKEQIIAAVENAVESYDFSEEIRENGSYDSEPDPDDYYDSMRERNY